MLKAVQEGKLNVFLTAPTSDTNAGTLVKLGASGNMVVCQPGDEPYGILAQDVRNRAVNNFKLDSVTHLAFYGEKAGVYFGGGQYYTDNIVGGAFGAGTKLYVGANGAFTPTAPSSGNFLGAVAIAETSGNTGVKTRITFLK
jgi:hypothetical protein